MAGLDRRLRVLEERFGPAIVQATAPRGSIPWTPSDQLQLAEWARYRLGQLRRMLEASPNNSVWLEEVATIEHGHFIDKCYSCGAWPMAGIRVDRDRAVRCGDCQALRGWLPPFDCAYFGHKLPCRCGYAYRQELEERWVYWSLLEEQAQRLILEFGGVTE